MTKVLQAGSWRKGTALKPRDGQEIDIDLAVFLNVEEATKSDIAGLHSLIVSLLADIVADGRQTLGGFSPIFRRMRMTAAQR